MAKDRRCAPYALVVDDNPMILLFAADILDTAGFSVFAAADCNHAVAILAQYGDELPLLFTNVEIPGPMNGFELARDTSSRWPAMSILVSSGRFEPGEGSMPDDGIFLPKPFTEDEVLASLRKLFAVKNGMLLRDARLSLGQPGLAAGTSTDTTMRLAS